MSDVKSTPAPRAEDAEALYDSIYDELQVPEHAGATLNSIYAAGVIERMIARYVAAARAEALSEVAARVERLRLTRPMNGDGSNYMLDKVLGQFPESVQPAVDAERRARAEREAESDRRLAEQNAEIAREAGERK